MVRLVLSGVFQKALKSIELEELDRIYSAIDSGPNTNCRFHLSQSFCDSTNLAQCVRFVGGDTSFADSSNVDPS